MGWSHVFSSVSQSDVRKAAPAQVCRNIRFRRHCFWPVCRCQLVPWEALNADSRIRCNRYRYQGRHYFVNLDKDSDGSVTAITSNMAHINTLSTDILNSVIASTDNGVINVSIPFGNLTGLNLMLNKGPDVNVQIIMLTSSRVDFRNEVVSCGINQAKYQLVLEVTIDIDVLIPWGTESATTVTEVIVADTVIVGKVPNTYLNMEN